MTDANRIHPENGREAARPGAATVHTVLHRGSRFDVGQRQRAVEDDLGEFRQLRGETPESVLRMEQMPHINAEHFAVFEGIQALLAFGHGRRLLQGMLKLPHQFGMTGKVTRDRRLLQHR